MSKGRNSQSSRQIVIQQMLQAAGARGLSPREITEKLVHRGYVVTKRTIHRDIEGLLAAGIPISESGSRSDAGGIRWKIDLPPSLTKAGQSAIIKIDSQQLAGLYMAKEQFKKLGQSNLFKGMEHFFEQVSDLIGAKNRALLDDFSESIHVERNLSVPTGINPDTVAVIRSAIAEGQCFQGLYASANSGTVRLRKFGPHSLYFAEGGLYLIAEDMEDQKIKVFAIQRLSDALLLDECYERDSKKILSFFESSFGVWHAENPSLIEIKIQPAQATYVKERQWHASQEIIPQPDGSIILKMNVGVTPNLVSWILGFGDHAFVIGPEELRQDVVRAATGVCQLYLKKSA